LLFSKKVLTHDIIIGLFINRYEFAGAKADYSTELKRHSRPNAISPACAYGHTPG
jgi:hypothetical protein